MQVSLQNLAAVIASGVQSDRLDEILSHEVQDGTNTMKNDGYDIEFSNVGFSYETGDVVLKDVSFVAKQGEVTALIGPSGGGKTTVSRLASRFWDANRGSITVGGMDISKANPETLMSLYSIVFQDVTLFDNTVMENIRLGKKGAADEEVEPVTAATVACQLPQPRGANIQQMPLLRCFSRQRFTDFIITIIPAITPKPNTKSIGTYLKLKCRNSFIELITGR